MNAASVRAGISSGHWSNIEGDRVSQPSIYVVAKMAKAIGASLDDLMYDVPPPLPRDVVWAARRAREGDPGREVEEFCRRRREFRTRDVAEVFGRSASSAHLARLKREGKIRPVDPTLPPTSPNWRYRWVEET